MRRPGLRGLFENSLVGPGEEGLGSRGGKVFAMPKTHVLLCPSKSDVGACKGGGENNRF